MKKKRNEMKCQCRGIKSNFPWKPTFENGPHAKSWLSGTQEIHGVLIPNGLHGPLE